MHTVSWKFQFECLLHEMIYCFNFLEAMLKITKIQYIVGIRYTSEMVHKYEHIAAKFHFLSQKEQIKYMFQYKELVCVH